MSGVSAGGISVVAGVSAGRAGGISVMAGVTSGDISVVAGVLDGVKGGIYVMAGVTAWAEWVISVVARVSASRPDRNRQKITF